MERLRCVLGPALLAVAVCVVAAGPAVAAKGGNSDSAHACQQGGHESRFEAETGRPFRNAGDCASHGAQGGATSSLQILATPTYGCPPPQRGTCWGTVSGSGLQPNSQWNVRDASSGDIVASGTADSSGSVNANLNEEECLDVVEFTTEAVTSAGQTLNALLPPMTSPCV
jgi:hypothetical protein